MPSRRRPGRPKKSSKPATSAGTSSSSRVSKTNAPKRGRARPRADPSRTREALTQLPTQRIALEIKRERDSTSVDLSDTPESDHQAPPVTSVARGRPSRATNLASRWRVKPTEQEAAQSWDAYVRRRMFPQRNFSAKNDRVKCWFCRVSHKPYFGDWPLIHENDETIPCGHSFKDAVIEEWMVERGWLKNVPASEGFKTAGRARFLFCKMFEEIFGELTPEKLYSSDISQWHKWLRVPEGNIRNRGF